LPCTLTVRLSPLSLPDALPILAEGLVAHDQRDAVAGQSQPEGDPRLLPDARGPVEHRRQEEDEEGVAPVVGLGEADDDRLVEEEDRKSTRLNSSHVKISYAVFC